MKVQAGARRKARVPASSSSTRALLKVLAIGEER
jgi:hypothetical protein